ncbi:DciA family protein [Thiosulfativibrio zosterae]|uniref:DUF721 domain-containing protein n=1 Tax=Thiosulfativibrio zosterae TaxID=2675053 RepID=A0A6F8PLH1_9GAMM|nr:DciA family protein [Thiosulfativibrio zosterae]BBP42936.1 hypothetical protein THMIRHAT_06820 [Thiosulfativibrio zosterae]
MKSLLNQSGHGLAHIMEQAELFQALLSLGQSCLSEKLKPHLIGVGFEENTLICQLDDNLWSTQLRFFEPELLKEYQTHFPHLRLQRIKIQILPIAERTLIKPQTMERPTLSCANEMRLLSQKVHSKGLSSALEKLSQRALEE